MSETSGLNHGKRCWRCSLPTFDPVKLKQGWCGFCRAFTRDNAEGWSGDVPVFRLGADKQAHPCTPAQVGNWMCTGREPVAYSTVYLRGRVQAMLTTMFLVVDYWPYGPVPLLFETKLLHMHTAKTFDAYQQRYATYAEAKIGHEAALERIRAQSPRVS